MENFAATIESILIWKAEPIAKKKLASILECDLPAVEQALEALKQSLQNRGVVLLEKDGEVELRTAPGSSGVLEKLQKEELMRDLGKAGLETLTIILYQGPISRREIDYIRGVNSAFIIRNLQIRGLIEKISNPEDQRSFLYRPTFDLLGHLGITDSTALPDYELFRKEIEQFKKTIEEKSDAEIVPVPVTEPNHGTDN